MIYHIKRVDGTDDEIAEAINQLHDTCFGSSAPKPETDQDFWWLAYLGELPVAFGQVVLTAHPSDTVGYLKRSGVHPLHRGQGLQLRLIRVREALARKQGWTTLVTDTTSNPASSNTLIKAGYRLFMPQAPWAFDHSLYWRKTL